MRDGLLPNNNNNHLFELFAMSQNNVFDIVPKVMFKYNWNNF